ncbi:hypothetical protein RvY_01029 [Ramazzottius varieornatus]|uniref:Uncharacterized protein n=1 Tax=Ramazzottius varieornatus TaxID=947166 RepID=A0A1D1UPL5_RAMVA|nr:hypothetical protein RvY_01029 [Ramazzottius varieornatus]
MWGTGGMLKQESTCRLRQCKALRHEEYRNLRVNAPDKEPGVIPEGAPKPSLEDATVKNFPSTPKSFSLGYSNWTVVDWKLSTVPRWYSSMRDEEQLRHADTIRQRIMPLKPRVFRNVMSVFLKR